ncbi:MAG: RsmD family RNA methyltransferase [Flavitalea sp.]
MRIIGGESGGRRIHPPAKMPYTRPTTDIAKEGLFNILENNLDISTLYTCDLFGGTGSITYELCSRGAKECVIVENDPAMFAFIQKTAKELKFANIHTVKMEVFKFISQTKETFDLIFAGPPYALPTIDDLPAKIHQRNLLKPNGWFILEHTPRNDYTSFPQFATARNYGTTIFSIFVNK